MGPSSHPARSRSNRFTPRLGLARLACAAGAAAAALAGCSSTGSAPGSSAQGETADGPPAVLVSGLDDLAEKAGCGGKLSGQSKAAELRQGVCKTEKGRFTLVTFASDKDQRTWLQEAKNWGGTYLIGPRWIAVSEEPNLQSLRQTLGGDIEFGRKH